MKQLVIFDDFQIFLRAKPFFSCTMSNVWLLFWLLVCLFWFQVTNYNLVWFFSLEKLFLTQYYCEKKSFMAPFYEWVPTMSRLQSYSEETVYFLPLRPQEFLVLISLTLEGWKAESTLEPPNGFEPWTPRLILNLGFLLVHMSPFVSILI